MEHIPAIRDPRQLWAVAHTLSDIIFLTNFAVIADTDGWEDIRDFGEDQLASQYHISRLRGLLE